MDLVRRRIHMVVVDDHSYSVETFLLDLDGHRICDGFDYVARDHDRDFSYRYHARRFDL